MCSCALPENDQLKQKLAKKFGTDEIEKTKRADCQVYMLRANKFLRSILLLEINEFLKGG